MDLTDAKAFDTYAAARGWAYDNHGRYRDEHWDWYAGPVPDIVLLRQPPNRVALVRIAELTLEEIWSGHVSTGDEFDQVMTFANTGR